VRRPEAAVTTWVAVLLVAAGSYALRLLPLLLAPGRRWPLEAETGLRYAGYGAVAFLLVGAVRDAAHARSVGLPLTVGLAVGLVAVARRRSLPVVVLAGLGACWAMGVLIALTG
jgi:branched-subunit amino acid transport protein